MECLACCCAILTALAVEQCAQCSRKVLTELLLDVTPAAAAVHGKALSSSDNAATGLRASRKPAKGGTGYERQAALEVYWLHGAVM